MSSPQVSNPTPVQDSNRNCQYNAQELAVINPFKEEYFSADTPVQRKTIAQTLIYPALFNYWESIGKGVRGDDNMTREIQVSVLNIFLDGIISKMLLRTSVTLFNGTGD